jgi:hypothetical protein
MLDNNDQMPYELDPEGLADQRPALRDVLFRLQTLLVTAQLSCDPFVLLDLDEAQALFVETVDLWRDSIEPARLACSRRRLPD